MSEEFKVEIVNPEQSFLSKEDFRKTDEENYYVEDGILEFKDNNLSILTSTIFKVSELDKNKIENLISESEKASQQENLDDQSKFLIDQKIEVLKTLN